MLRRRSPRGLDARTRDVLLISLSFASGAVDAISFLGLGKVFTANMTGNIVLLGLAVGRAAGAEALRAAVSLVAFVAGAFAAALLARRSSTAGVWRREVTIVLGIEVVVQSLFVVGWFAASGRPGRVLEGVLVGLSALAMGLQSSAVAAVRIAGITTTYVTGTLAGLIRQLATSTGAPGERVRRALTVAAVFVGAGCSSLLVINAREVAAVLPLAISSLVLATASYFRGTFAAVGPAALAVADENETGG